MVITLLELVALGSITLGVFLDFIHRTRFSSQPGHFLVALLQLCLHSAHIFPVLVDLLFQQLVAAILSVAGVFLLNQLLVYLQSAKLFLELLVLAVELGDYTFIVLLSIASLFMFLRALLHQGRIRDGLEFADRFYLKPLVVA